MIKQIQAFLISLLIATFLLVTHTTATNLFWLQSIGMPVDMGIVALMPLAFYNLDLIAGARTLGGKVYLVLAGVLAGYYFGSHPQKGGSNDTN